MITSTYAQMTFCPPCSNELERCMICGNGAPVASNYIPPKTLGSQQQAVWRTGRNSQSTCCGAVMGRVAEKDPDTPNGSFSATRPITAPQQALRLRWSGDASIPAAASNYGAGLPYCGRFRPGLGFRWQQPYLEPGSSFSAAAALKPRKAGASRGRSTRRRLTTSNEEWPGRSFPRPGSQAHFNLDPAVDRGADKDGTWQGMYTLATDRLDQMLDYLGTFQLPGMDMNQWSTCMNSSDQHDISEFREGSRRDQGLVCWASVSYKCARRSDSRDTRRCSAHEGSFLQPPWHLHAIITGGDFLVHAEH
ncbi:hypothetical protein AK812_SmicGene36868 [Symbiodinium microadriaticum]|uniref:Uncharacterized protein n=1 Tax=Symbiodinium microadriaticum TaxID=2951 RepID=A0A1Q9CHR7_SYMMI|nr:hypothetical protein AK812_SmicGene36868 [Symbiodinium microadriaticum]